MEDRPTIRTRPCWSAWPSTSIVGCRGLPVTPSTTAPTWRSTSSQPDPGPVARVDRLGHPSTPMRAMAAGRCRGGRGPRRVDEHGLQSPAAERRCHRDIGGVAAAADDHASLAPAGSNTRRHVEVAVVTQAAAGFDPPALVRHPGTAGRTNTVSVATSASWVEGAADSSHRLLSPVARNGR